MFFVPPLEVQQHGSWRSWSEVAEHLCSRQGCAAHIADWADLSCVTHADPGGDAKSEASPLDSRPYVGALAELLASEVARGKVEFIAAAHNSSLFVLQALRLLQLTEPTLDLRGLSVAAVAPDAWAAPLRRHVGHSYPSRLARRQRVGFAVYRALASLGAGRVASTWLAPDFPSANPALAVSWWLGHLDPATGPVDVARELLLAARAADPEVSAAFYAALRAAANAREAAADDADDDDFLVGATSRSSAKMLPVHAEAQAPEDAAPVPAGRPFLGQAVRLLLMLPEDSPPEQQLFSSQLERAVQHARSQLAAGQQASAEEVCHMESTLLKVLLELEDTFGATVKIEPPSSEPSPVDTVLPISVRSTPHSFASFSDHPEDVVQDLDSFLLRRKDKHPHK